MRTRQLLLASVLSLGFITACDSGTDPLTISYIGVSSYSVHGEENYATFTIPFKLSRELKNGEKMDEVRFDHTHEYNADGSNFSYAVDGTSLTLTATVTLTSTNFSGMCEYAFSVNALKSSGESFAHFVSPIIKFNVSQKNSLLGDVELGELLETKNFELESTTPTYLTKKYKTINIHYHSTGACTADYPVVLGLYKKDSDTPLQIFPQITFLMAKSEEGSGKIELGTLTDENWNALENEEVLLIKEVTK